MLGAMHPPQPLRALAYPAAPRLARLSMLDEPQGDDDGAEDGLVTGMGLDQGAIVQHTQIRRVQHQSPVWRGCLHLYCRRVWHWRQAYNLRFPTVDVSTAPPHAGQRAWPYTITASRRAIFGNRRGGSSRTVMIRLARTPKASHQVAVSQSA